MQLQLKACCQASVRYKLNRCYLSVRHFHQSPRTLTWQRLQLAVQALSEHSLSRTCIVMGKKGKLKQREQEVQLLMAAAPPTTFLKGDVDAQASENTGSAGARLINLRVQIVRAKDLPRTDIIGHTDAYVVLSLRDPHNGRRCITYKTRTVYRTSKPMYNEELFVHNFPAEGAVIDFIVWDRNFAVQHEYIASGALTLDLSQTQEAEWHEKTVDLLNRSFKPAGVVHVKVCWASSVSPEGGLRFGPVRYRIARSPVAGRLTDEAASLAFKVYMLGVRMFFEEGAMCAWNRGYAKARMIFSNTAAVKLVQSQHFVLYKNTGKESDRGVLSHGNDFLRLIGHGARGGQARYYTYVLLEDSLRFSETGAAFFTDFMSKHAMHAACAEKVVYAGEFCILPNEDNPGMHTLVLDNNSGTYAPPADLLPAMTSVLQLNLPGLAIRHLAADDPELLRLHSLVPSRCSLHATMQDHREQEGELLEAIASGIGRISHDQQELQQQLRAELGAESSNTCGDIQPAGLQATAAQSMAAKGDFSCTPVKPFSVSCMSGTLQKAAEGQHLGPLRRQARELLRAVARSVGAVAQGVGQGMGSALGRPMGMWQGPTPAADDPFACAQAGLPCHAEGAAEGHAGPFASQEGGSGSPSAQAAYEHGLVAPATETQPKKAISTSEQSARTMSGSPRTACLVNAVDGSLSSMAQPEASFVGCSTSQRYMQAAAGRAAGVNGITAKGLVEEVQKSLVTAQLGMAGIAEPCHSSAGGSAGAGATGAQHGDRVGDLRDGSGSIWFSCTSQHSPLSGSGPSTAS